MPWGGAGLGFPVIPGMGGGTLPEFIFPSGDTTGVTDSANIATTLANNWAVLTPGNWFISTPILVDSYQTLMGLGYGTLIETGTSFSGSYMIQNKTPATSVECTIKAMRLYPSANGASGVGGVQLDNTGFTPSGFLSINDTSHVVEDVLVIQAGGDSFHFDNRTRNICIRRCDSYNAGNYGFYLGNSGGAGSGCTDSQFTNCTAGHSGNHGFNILDANNMFTSCKAWGSGYSGPLTGGTISGTTQCGFEVMSTAKNTFAGCQAQQNALHGYDLQSCFQCAISGCDSDANGAGTGVITGMGININASTQCTITGNCGQPTLAGQPGNQIYGVQVSGTCSATWIAANSVTGVTNTFHDAGASNYTVFDNTNISDLTHINNLRFGSPEFYEGPTQFTVINGFSIVMERNQGAYSLTAAANVTGLILYSGNAVGGNTILLRNTSAFTMTFDVPGVSNVADGAADVIASLEAAVFTYDSFTALWYRAY